MLRLVVVDIVRAVYIFVVIPIVYSRVACACALGCVVVAAVRNLCGHRFCELHRACFLQAAVLGLDKILV